MRTTANLTGILIAAGVLLAQPTLAQTNSGWPVANAPAPEMSGAPADPNVVPDEPGRPVARVALLNGEMSVRRGDSGDWVAAAVNAPLMTGDTISIAPSGRAEVQIDSNHVFRIGADSELRFSALDAGRYQVQLAHGILTWRVLRDSAGTPATPAEISTPLVSVRPGRLATVRVEVTAPDAVRILVRHGEADVFGPRGSEHLREGQTMDVKGDSGNPLFQTSAAVARDEWDNWNDQRDGYYLRAQSPRYTSPDMYGVEDLDANGRWVWDPAYGWVWAPNVQQGWAPYQNGQWSWEDYYGWTWIPYEPWGWAPFHYGYWYVRPGFGWAWFPGPRFGRIWWRPAMVGFVGFGGFGVGGFASVGWVPLFPYERFHPWYGRGFAGGRTVIVNNITNTNITNVYRNARVAGGVTAVSGADFQRGAFDRKVALGQGDLERASLVHGGVPVAPGANHLAFANHAAVAPRNDAIARQSFYSRTPVSTPARTPFTQQQSAVRQMMQNPAAARPMTAASPAPQASGGWQRFGAPATGQAQSGRPLGLGAPVVQQRQASQMATPQGSPRFGAPAPGYGAPAARPMAPAPAPRPMAPAPAPRPAAPQGGGPRGGGAPAGHPSGGGAHSGGGSHRH